ncbi:hypothetical protein T12_3829 [Trichinella patagoniensis]|uniref:Uncharacterized protein n=1 Tax=Trichinella patagoniensis TaxID=990121 RepID=A0A0V1A631_9BILA|nr:hypothetical protein T12_3829 [Trichinella patagoniensis]
MTFSQRQYDGQETASEYALFRFRRIQTSRRRLNTAPEIQGVRNLETLIKKFEEKYDLIETWKVAVDYPKLRELTRNILVLFGSNCMCEVAFSRYTH